MSNQQAPKSLDSMSDDEILKMVDEFSNAAHAYVAHRNSPVAKGAQRAPFNFQKFLANFIDVYNTVAPFVSNFSNVKLPPISLPPGLA